jgi:aryl-alcohol dehydrogenase-like predicted oxidoreductase
LNQRPFGDTGVTVGEIGFGAWAVGAQSWGGVEDENSLAAVREARALGVTFFDTAQEYGCGHSERILGQGLEADADAFITTKVGKWWYGKTFDTFQTDFSAAFISGMADGSLARLGVERIDLYQLHNPGIAACERDETWAALENLVKAGKIRFYGASIGTEEELELCLERGCKGLQFEYNLLRPQRRDWIAKATDAGVGVIIRTPLAWGALTGKYEPGYELPEDDFRHESNWGGKAFRKFVGQAQELRFLEREGQTMSQAALRYVLAEPGVAVVIPGGKTPEQVRDNCAAAEAGLTGEELARIAELQAEWLVEEKEK